MQSSNNLILETIGNIGSSEESIEDIGANKYYFNRPGKVIKVSCF